ncbi:Glutamine--fructose-6-phosphate aminotransferase [isomerizing] [compost metagenome]
MIAFYLFALYLAEVKGTQTEDQVAHIIAAMQSLPEQVESILADVEEVKTYAEGLVGQEDLFFIGRGLDYAVVQEGSLKLKEISYIHSEAYAAGELKHGTLALIEDGIPVIALATQESVIEKTVSNIKEVTTRGAEVLAITFEEHAADLLRSVNQVIAIPKTLPLLTPALSVVPLQLLAYYASRARGNDVDKPRNLAKSVTVE